MRAFLLKHRRYVVLDIALVTLVAVVLLLWKLIVATAALAFVLNVCRHKLGFVKKNARPKSSWSTIGKTGAIMYAAWNSRWLKPGTHGIKASHLNNFDAKDWQT